MSPGVGSYNISQSMDFVSRSNPKVRIGTSVRKATGSMLSIPGPCEYSPTSNELKKSPRAVIGTSSRDFMNRTVNFPGPDKYVTSKPIGMTKYKQITMRGKNILRDLNISPGPIYNTMDSLSATKRKEPAYKIGTDVKIARDKKSSKDSPGPGQYNNSII